jgi:hypothetical protein
MILFANFYLNITFFWYYKISWFLTAICNSLNNSLCHRIYFLDSDVILHTINFVKFVFQNKINSSPKSHIFVKGHCVIKSYIQNHIQEGTGYFMSSQATNTCFSFQYKFIYNIQLNEDHHQSN